ncbi:helix-turn-helix transcriptional regulator [Alkalihalobacterium chitinilyticum]|uniref:Transcriptional regulator n=1 Tax=Alkalihalobacterium chitinilyticum TaxID=2980103 RepID=A0ABT5VIP0_9BACI|nr:metalloregulator ArsR/SmtB family transcription factor [Alkalihalobacterium chitinilyticum]MDE5415326.1 transcriptional regulator [Alkalihalobacterium chitinilyticum]
MDSTASSTREQILQLLKKHKSLTVANLASHLGITEMAVRRHLGTLERDNVVETKMVRQAMGRPTTMYSLSQEGEELFPRNYASLTLGFLKDIEKLSGKQMIDQLFELRKQRMKEELEDRFKGKSFEERIKELADFQSNNGYMVEWEKSDDGTIHFKEYNCPISQIANEYPVACACEQSLFQELLETKDIECETCMAINETPHCYYKIKAPENNE